LACIISLPPNTGEFYPNHDHLHAGQEEVYVVLDGGGAIAIDAEQVALAPDVAVRVPPASKRQLLPGEEGQRQDSAGTKPSAPTQRSGLKPRQRSWTDARRGSLRRLAEDPRHDARHQTTVGCATPLVASPRLVAALRTRRRFTVASLRNSRALRSPIHCWRRSR
jgi:hypothetical protein